MLVIDYSRQVRIRAPVQTVWAYLSDLNCFLRFVSETHEFQVDEDGMHARCRTQLAIGPFTFPTELQYELVELTFPEKLVLKSRIASLQTGVDGSITLRHVSVRETSVNYCAQISTDHKVLRRFKGTVAAQLEEHVDDFCSNAAAFIGRRAQAEDQLLHTDE